jgi:hypothetical protein
VSIGWLVIALPGWHILSQQASTCIDGTTGKNHANGKDTGPRRGAHYHATQLVDFPPITREIAMPRAPWSYRLAILQHGSNMRAHSCFPGTKIE